MKKRFDSDYYKWVRETLVEEAANEYIRDGMSPEDAWEQAEQDTPIPYDIWESEMQEYADIQRRLNRRRSRPS